MFHEGTTPVTINWDEENGFKPVLRFYDPIEEIYRDTEIEVGDEIRGEISSERVCLGYYDNEREHVPCPENMSPESGDQCEECGGRDFYRGLQRGYSGMRHRHPYFDTEYTVYVAGFGDKPKVGITRDERFPKRVIEQGADGATKIYSAEHVDEAHEIESEIANKTSITDKVRKETKVEKTEKKLDYSLFDKARRKIEKIGVSTLENQVLSLGKYYPGTENLDARYTVFDGKGRNKNPRGEVVAIKGQIVFSSSGQAISVSSLSGQIIKEREQRGLGSF